MEWLRRGPESSAPARNSSRNAARCRREECVARLAELKAEVKGLEAIVRPLQRSFRTEVEGQVRCLHVELSEAKIQLESKSVSEAYAMRMRRVDAKAARKLAEENE